MVEQLQASPVVSSCTILSESTTVSSKGNISTEETITAKVDIVFKTATQIQKEAEEAEQEAEAQAETVQAEQETKPSRSIPENGLYTTKEDVALYLRLYGHLPENFITKAQAEALGWDGGSLRGSAPGMSIGGDPFGNYEGRLPSGHTYYECDINTMGKDDRGAERLVFSDDGLIYYTGDHYETFTLLYGTP
ncbi:MAG: ribonuclease [Oscillibacter sp.]|nr:ribonuclease [Oscillibacter sp.]